MSTRLVRWTSCIVPPNTDSDELLHFGPVRKDDLRVLGLQLLSLIRKAPAVPLRGYPETGVGKTVDLLDSWRTSYQHRSARPWFIEYCRERTILPI
jgi:hypothetical protein